MVGLKDGNARMTDSALFGGSRDTAHGDKGSWTGNCHPCAEYLQLCAGPDLPEHAVPHGMFSIAMISYRLII